MIQSQAETIEAYLRDVPPERREALSLLSLGKGCIRFCKPAQIDFDLVEKLLLETKQSSAEAC